VEAPGIGPVTGDVAWGGNWFFLTDAGGEALTRANVERLTERTRRIRAALAEQGITGADGAEIDHIELCGPPHDPRHHGRNFVLCPGGAYDRSPCGTGTSAKLACLAAAGQWNEGDTWRQESVIGSVFEATYRRHDAGIIPRLTGTAHVTAEATLLIDAEDPFAWGIP
jgi:4-hydroxyproline epimerase